MVNTVSKIGWEGGGSTSIWIMYLKLLIFFTVPLTSNIIDYCLHLLLLLLIYGEESVSTLYNIHPCTQGDGAMLVVLWWWCCGGVVGRSLPPTFFTSQVLQSLHLAVLLVLDKGEVETKMCFP